AGQPSGRRRRSRAGGNRYELFGVRQGDHCPLQADAGPSGVLQGMLPVPEIRRGRRRLARPFVISISPRCARRGRDGVKPGCVKLRDSRFGAGMSMQIVERSVGDVVVLDLKGKITLGEGDELLKDKVNSLVNQGHRKILLNFADVPYVDSAGLGEVVRTYTTVSRQGGSLKLLNLTKRITDLLAITKLLTV